MSKITKIRAFQGLYFPTIALYEEFIDSKRTDPRVRMRTLELGLIIHSLNKQLVISGISRTEKRNIEIYGHDRQSGHREKPARAIDFGSSGLGIEVITALKNHFSIFLDDGRYYSLINHDVGFGKHLHLQVPHRDYNKILWKVSI